jgi:2,4-dienoyl-CoA reductase-like NADH-dependent reductase (Old Yellow Enzyme family)
MATDPGAPSSQATQPLLFTPLTIRGVTIKNRIMSSPMCQYRSVDGRAVDWHLAYLGRLAIGGAGIVFCEETAVERRGRKTYECAGLWKRAQVAPLRRVARLIEEIGSVPAIQLGHSGGRAASHGAARDWAPLTEADRAAGLAPWRPICASAVRLEPNRQVCKAMDKRDLDKVVRAFADAAARAMEAGFKILEVHAAHGYLIHQFLSPVTNLRSDAYGGDRRGRMRFALEIAEAVRAAISHGTPLFFRVSCVDGRGGLWNLDDTLALASELKLRGVDAIDCSSGGISGTSSMPLVPRVPGYHVPYARRVRAEAGISTIAVGLITEPQQAEEVLRSGSADIVALARGLMESADWPVKAAMALGLRDPYGVFPESFAFRLRRREEISRMAINRADGLTAREAAIIETT